VLGAQLAAFPSIRTRIIERREGALQLGQADGIACRSMEMFEAFGIADRILAEAAQITETVFWRPSADDRSRVARSGRVQDVEDGLSEFPHVILNQARVQDFLLEKMRTSPRQLTPDYGTELVDLDVTEADDYPVVVRTRSVATGEEQTVRARCRRLRWSPKHRAHGDRPRTARRFSQPGLGRDGRARSHRLSRHPLQVRGAVL
jgi:phenol 2-monooxygenase